MELQERLKLKPVLSPYLIYIINPAEALNEIASNKLLKTIEEPNPNIIGFMITKNSDILLPTIKSRCETISLMYDNDKEDCDISEEVYSLVDELVQAIENRNHEKYYSIKNNDKILKNSAKEVENLIKDYYNTACNLGADNKLNPDTINLIRKNNTYKQLIKKAKYLNLTINKLSQNMNSDLLLEKIFIELKEVN
jgi:DNA polymerase III delta prime subunit